jgi:ribosomal protein S18 acetylase RimI-like enzyme
VANIAPFTIEAYDDVLALWRACEGVGLSDADSRDNIRAYLARNPGLSFIALTEGHVVGAILAGHDGRRGHIHHLAVHPDFRRQGLGRRLVDHALTALAREGIRKCHLFVFHTNTECIAVWESAGWTRRSDIGVMSRVIDVPPA